MKIPNAFGGRATAMDNLFSRLWQLAPRANHLLTAIGQEGVELIASLLVLVWVERTYGQQGLGVYAYLTACLYTVRYLANFGVARHMEIETARLDDGPHRNQRIFEGYQATLFTSLGGALILLASSGFDASHTRLHERMAAYIIMALVLPMANLNTFKLAVMQGLGQHCRAARLRMLRHGLILMAIFFLIRIHVPPSYLLSGFIFTEMVAGFRIRHHLKIRGFWTAFKQPRMALNTLKQGQHHLFTDNALDHLLNIDLFVLGIFVSAWDLGIYAEAAVLVRLFLIISQGIKPILRRQYTLLAAHQQHQALSALFRRNSALLFSLQSMLTLVTLLHFPAILDILFELRGETVQSFQFFLMFVPGLIFYAVFSAQEPIYEALGQADELKRLTLVTAGFNLLLCLYLVPAAGSHGAAAATMTTMLIHFFLFGRHLPKGHDIPKSTFLSAGLALYLVYTLLEALAWSAVVNLCLGLILLLSGFYGCGVFGVTANTEKRRAWGWQRHYENRS